jgi:hypothetical protein
MYARLSIAVVSALALQTPPPATATLQLSLRAPDGTTRAAKLDLWRIGIPAEPGFTAGDERVGRFELPAAGLAIPDLAPGTYRILTDAHSASAPDLAPFAVQAPRTELAFDVLPSKEREAFVDLVDMMGKPIAAAEYKSHGRSGSVRKPGWAHMRAKIEEDGSQTSTGYGGQYSSKSSHSSFTKVARGPRGFPVGRDLEDGQLFTSTRSFALRVAERDTFWGQIRCDAPEEPWFRAVLVEKARFAGLFTLPDDTPLDLNRLHVSTPLVPDVEPRPEQWWLDVPVTVTVVGPECKPLKLEFKLRDGLPKPQRLERKP